MLKTEGKNWLLNFRIKWVSLEVLAVALISLAVAQLLTSATAYWFVTTAVFPIAFVTTTICLLLIKPLSRFSDREMLRYLNAKFPELEESAALILKPTTELSLLEQMQLDRINQALPIKNGLTPALKKLFIGIVLVLSSFGLSNLFTHSTSPSAVHSTTPVVQQNSSKEVILPEVAKVELIVRAPAYTGKGERRQQQFNLKVETGAAVTWQIKTNVSAGQLKLIFNDKEIVALKAIDESAKTWICTKSILQNGYYQLVVDGKKSDLYQVEVIPDLPVYIKITNPKPHHVIDVGEVPKVNLNVTLTDDYGIANAFISATMASGKGEGVSFTEKKLFFSTVFNSKKEMKLNKLLDLNALGMKPGDELYFFVNAVDNHGQQSRSDVYLITIVDPAELLSMAGMTNGIDLVPEYFRSQRQIIIDTEKLIKEKSSLSVVEVNNRSNTLGIDQKLLRLRYGKFLGEVAETEVGGEHEHEEGEGHAEPAQFGDVQAIMDEYAHKHDIAEDATFFEPELKAQLKAVLNEMWSSELNLRTYKLQEALPFQYKALRLLKDLQQKSRAYVAKTTIKTTKLKLEKRLTGELNKILSPSLVAANEREDRATLALKVLLAVLEERKTGKAFDVEDRQLIRDGEKQLIAAAALHPASYLKALKSLRALATAQKSSLSDIDIVQQAIQKIIGKEDVKPQSKVAAPASGLAQNYFNYLKNTER